MRRLTTLVTAWFCFCCLLHAHAVSFLQIPLVETPVQVDGVIDDPCWQVSQRIHPFVRDDEDPPPEAATTAWIARSQEALLIAFECMEPNVADLVAQHESRDAELWRDDCVEVFIDPDPDSPRYWHLIVNSNGALYDALARDRTWNGDVAVGVEVKEDRWCVEISVPFSDIEVTPGTGQRWRLNLCRERKVEGELSAWSRTWRSFHNRNAFGDVVFEDPTLIVKDLDAGALKFGLNRLEGTIDNATDQSIEMRAVLRVTQANETTTYDQGPVTVAPGQEATLNIPFAIDEGGSVEVVAELLSDGPFYSRSFSAEIKGSGGLSTLQSQARGLETLLEEIPDDEPVTEDLSQLLAKSKATLAEGIRARRALVESPSKETETRMKESADRARQLASELSRLSHLTWIQSPWLNFGRRDLPQGSESLGELTADVGLNEYDSLAFMITNLLSEPYTARVKVGPFTRDLPQLIGELSPGERKTANWDFAEGEMGGFPGKWSFVNKGGAAHLEEVDGERCLVYGDTNDDAVSVRQNLDLEQGKRYILSARVRALDEGAAAGSIYLINAGWTWSTRLAIPSPGAGWTDQTRIFTAPESPAHQVVIYMPKGVRGRAAVTDVAVIEEDAIDREAPQPREVVLRSPQFVDLRTHVTVADPMPALGQAGIITVPPGETRQVWLTLHSRGMVPGDYVADLQVKPVRHGPGGGRSSAYLRIRMRVRPFRLNDFPEMEAYNWDYAGDGSYVADLAAHKVRNYLVSTGLKLPSFAEDGSPAGEIDFSDYDRMLRIKLACARQAGGLIIFSYGILRDFETRVSKRYGWEYMSPPWRQAFSFVFSSWVDHLKALGMTYDDYAVQLWDEATGPLHTGRVVEGGKLVRELDPQVRTVMDGAQNIDEARAMDPYVDLWIPHMSVLPPRNKDATVLDFYRSTGKPLWVYTCRTNMKGQPAYDYHRLKPWRAWRLGMDGVCYWAYNSWRGDPWDDFDGPIGDCGAVYDSANGPVTTRRWEAWREGLEDIQYLEMIVEAANEGEKRGGDLAELSLRERELASQTVKRVLSQPDQPETITPERLELSNALSRLVKAFGPDAGKLTTEIKEDRATWRFKTTQPTEGYAVYLIKGEQEWRRANFPRSTDHNVTVSLPAQATLSQFHIVAWNRWGAATQIPRIE